MPNLTILHTGDLHGGLSAEGTERIQCEKAFAGDCLLFDAGDAVSSGNIYYRPGGEPALTLMSDLGYDAIALGNREFHFLKPGLESKVKLARFPVLCANLRGTEDAIGPSIAPSISISIGGYEVAVLGLTVPMITKRMLVSKVSPYWFEDPIGAAQGLVPHLRDEADLVVALTHIGLKSDVALAGQVSGIDLIVGGHTHTQLQEPIRIGDTSIVHAGWWARYLGAVEISGSPGRLQISGRLLPLQPRGRSKG